MQANYMHIASSAAQASPISSPLASSNGFKPAHALSSRPPTAASSSSSGAIFALDPTKKKQTAFLRKSKESADGGVSSGGGKARCIWVGLPKAFLSLYDFNFSAGGAQADFERLHASRDFAQAAEILEGYMYVNLNFILSPSSNCNI
jgi:hypothetical protein